MKYCKYLMVLVAVTTSVVMMALDVNDFTFSHLGRSEGWRYAVVGYGYKLTKVTYKN